MHVFRMLNMNKAWIKFTPGINMHLEIATIHSKYTWLFMRIGNSYPIAQSAGVNGVLVSLPVWHVFSSPMSNISLISMRLITFI